MYYGCIGKHISPTALNSSSASPETDEHDWVSLGAPRADHKNAHLPGVPRLPAVLAFTIVFIRGPNAFSAALMARQINDDKAYDKLVQIKFEKQQLSAEDL
jgi:hypothetical protein